MPYVRFEDGRVEYRPLSAGLDEGMNYISMREGRRLMDQQRVPPSYTLMHERMQDTVNELEQTVDQLEEEVRIRVPQTLAYALPPAVNSTATATDSGMCTSWMIIDEFMDAIATSTPTASNQLAWYKNTAKTSEEYRQERLINEATLAPFYHEPVFDLTTSILRSKPASTSAYVPWWKEDTPYPGKSFVKEMMLADGHSVADYYEDQTWKRLLTSRYITNDEGHGVDPHHYKFIPYDTDNMWRFKAIRKLQDGTWKPFNWNVAGFYRQSPYAPTHMLHLSVEEPGYISYTPDNVYGKRERTIRTKPGRYLTKFFSDKLSPDQIKYLVSEFQAKYDPSKNQVLFTNNGNEVVQVYEQGPSSCMVKGRHDRYIRTNGHPVRVYDSPDVCVAYIRKSKTSVKQRVVINKVDKRFTKIYGEGPLREQLIALGYRPGTLHGCRLKRIEEDNDYLMPYLDYDIYVRDYDEDYWICNEDSGEYCNNTSGFLYRGDDDDDDDDDEDYIFCEDCDERTHLDHICHVDRQAVRSVCEDCYDHNYAEVESIISNNTYLYPHMDNLIEVISDYEFGTRIDIADWESCYVNWDDETQEYYTNEAYDDLLTDRKEEEDNEQLEHATA